MPESELLIAFPANYRQEGRHLIFFSIRNGSAISRVTIRAREAVAVLVDSDMAFTASSISREESELQDARPSPYGSTDQVLRFPESHERWRIMMQDRVQDTTEGSRRRAACR